MKGEQSEGASASGTDAPAPWYYPASILIAISSAFYSYATKKPNSLVAPSHEDTSLCAMCVYLRPYAEVLCMGSYNSSLTKVAEEINHIYSLMCSPLVMNNNGVQRNPLQLSQVGTSTCSQCKGLLSARGSHTNLKRVKMKFNYGDSGRVKPTTQLGGKGKQVLGWNPKSNTLNL